MGLRKKLVIAGAVVGSMSIGSAAYAYWTSTGEDTGSGSVGTSTDFGVVVTVPATPALVPGGDGKLVTIAVTSATPGQAVTDIELTVANVVGTEEGSEFPCTTGDFDVISPTISTPVTIGTSAVTWIGVVALKNTALNQDDCKNATFEVVAVVS